MAEKKQTDKYDVLRLDHQLCFPLYACAKEVVRRYKPFLDEIDLTYTQYITMMVLWEEAGHGQGARRIALPGFGHADAAAQEDGGQGSAHKRAFQRG